MNFNYIDPHNDKIELETDNDLMNLYNFAYLTE